ncbi:MAG: endonuclease Q family protein, partial [Desulfobacterota bacterium]|nr:endonuclease Q family protein [Thermodesulfobacteriota bacterium]
MKFIADFHIHSYLSRATSRDMNLENIYKWAQLKGVTVVGTGDFTNPKWLKEIKDKLEPAEPGLFSLKAKYSRPIDFEVPESCRTPVRFILSVEISSIYKKGERIRKVHNLIFFPDLLSVSRFNSLLQKLGNLFADGRPILGLDCKELLKLALTTSSEAYFVPAHIWTPHFSVLGANSGFDSLEECFEELTYMVRAAETGLSSDPPMNWRLSNLDTVTLVSNSDAHSPDRIGREANIFSTELSYFSIIDALNNPQKGNFLGTIEFFPEEGKYHFDGHRICGKRFCPEETIQNQGI